MPHNSLFSPSISGQSIAQLACLAGASLALNLAATPTAEAQEQKQDTSFDSPSNIFELLEERRREGLLQEGASWLGDTFGPALDPVETWRKQLHDDHGISWTLEATGLYQFRASSDGPQDTNVFDINFAGTWQAVKDHDHGNGYVGWLARYRGSTRGNTGAFDEGIGLVSNTHDIQTGEELWAILQLWYQHRWSDDALRLTVGKIDQGAYFNGSDYAGNTKELFLANPLSANPARGTPQEGLGINVAWFDPSGQWYTSAGFGDANAVNNDSPFKDFDELDFAYLAEFGWTPTFKMGPGTYRFTVMGVDESLTADSGWSFAFSGDQQVAQNLGVFLRYGVNEGDRLAIEQVASTGVVLNEPFGVRDDAIGLGGFWVEPADSSIDDQFGFETFWRMQLTQRMEFTPSLQWHINPNEAVNDDSSEFVGSLRLRMLF